MYASSISFFSFKILSGNRIRWKETRDLIPYFDKIFMHHSILPVSDSDGEDLVINETKGQYWKRLKELGFNNKSS